MSAARVLRGLVAAIAAGVASLGAARADTSVVLYGIADADVRVDRTAIGTLKSLGSGGQSQTRFGLRGSEDLGDGLKAVFNVEQDIDLGDNSVPQGNVTRTTPSSPVSSTGSRVFGRRAIVGLNSATWGEVRFGRDTTPYYRTWTAVDPFAAGMVAAGFNYAIGNVSRFDNAVAYDSPDVAGFRLALHWRAGEATTRDPAAGGPLDGGDALSASLTYARGPLVASASYLQTRPSGPGSAAIAHAAAVGATYDLDAAKLHALGFYADHVGTDRYYSYAVGVTVPLSAFKVLAVAARIDDRGSAGGAPNAANDASFFGAGVAYALSKRTNLYAAASRMVNRGAATFRIRDNDDYGLSTGANVPAGFDPWAAQLGVRHTF